MFILTLGPKGEHILGVDDEGILKPVSRLLDKDEAARNEQINKGGPKPGTKRCLYIRSYLYLSYILYFAAKQRNILVQ